MSRSHYPSDTAAISCGKVQKPLARNLAPRHLLFGVSGHQNLSGHRLLLYLESGNRDGRSPGAYTRSMPLGRLLITLGIVLVAAGLLVTFAGRLPVRLGRLPGDIYIHGKNSSFYFPLTTCIVVSALVSLVLWILRK